MCWGFGHSIKKCSTKRVIDDHKVINKILQSTISRSLWTIRKKHNTDKKTWPLYIRALAICNAVTTEFRQYGWARPQLIQCLALLKELNGYICTQCNGWGHKANDGYKNAKGKLIKHCATSKLVDMAF